MTSPPGRAPVAGAVPGGIVQIAYAVDDVDAAARSWARRVGAGPFFVRRHIELASATHGGAAAVFDHSSAYGQWGSVQVELVQVHRADPASLAAIVQHDTGIHHVAWFVPSFGEEHERVKQLGWPHVLTADTAHGLRFGFHDARHDLGHLVEFYEPSERLLGFYATVAAAAQGWDGTDPVREP